MEERAPTKRAKRHLGGEAPRSPAEVRTAPGRAGRREEEPIGRTAADHSIMWQADERRVRMRTRALISHVVFLILRILADRDSPGLRSIVRMCVLRMSVAHLHLM